MPSTAGGGIDSGSQTSPGEDPLEAGRAELGGASTKHVSSGDRKTLPVRYLSRRWLKSWSRSNSSGAETSPRQPPFLENDRLNRLPSYRFLFRAPPPKQTSRGATATAGDDRAEQPAPQTQDQGSRRSLYSYFSKSPSKTEAVTAVTCNSIERTNEASRPIEEEEPRRRRDLPQYASRGSLASWHGAPPPEYVSMKAVGGDSTPPPAYVSMKKIASSESSAADPPPSAEVMLTLLDSPLVA